MKRERTSIDGFVSRRSGQQLGDLHRNASPRPHATTSVRGLHSASQMAGHVVSRPGTLSRAEIDESLRTIDDQPVEEKKRRTRKHRGAKTKKPLTRGRVIKRILLILLIFAVLGAGYVGIRAWLAGSSIFQGNPLAIFQNQPLKTDANGRSNILIFGTNEDNIEGGLQHEGAYLTDSMMVLSIDQEKKNAYMVSVPRDLYVQYDDTTPCPEGFSGRINSVYQCRSNSGENEEAGAIALRDKIGEVLGLDIPYFVHVNHTVVEDAVDAVGGVTVTIDSPDPRGILDRNFDWRCNYECFFVNYENGETVQMDGEHALAFARARNASGGYGLPNGNFDREKNQQKVLVALRDKAVSAGTLTNLGKVTGLIDALGDNLRTNFETSEIQRLMSLGTDITPEKIESISLVDEENPVVTTGMIDGQSIVQPVLGLYDYSGIKSYIRQQISSDPVTKEQANVVVLNGSETAGVAQTEATNLEERGFIVSSFDNAPEDTYDNVEIYQVSDGNPATAAKLKQVFNVNIESTPLPFTVAAETDFVVIFGAPRSANSQ